MDFFKNLFDTSDFPARWTCGRWSSGHGWLHILADLGVWSAYFSIPVVLGYFIARRKDLPFRSIFLLFAAFILLCGITHLMEAVIFWWPAYRLAGMLKLATAIVSWTTVFALVRVAPNILAMRTPDELEREIVARKEAERGLQQANEVLEDRVEERTEELAKAVADLRAERELLSTTLASIGDAVITTDATGRVTNMNAVAESLTRWTTADALGVPLTSVFNILNETTRMAVDNPALRALKEGVIVGLANHTVLVAKDGTEIPIDDSAAPIRSKEGEVIGCVLVFRDISERHRTNEALRRNEERFRLAADAVNGIIYDADLLTGHVERTRGLYEVLGHRPDEVPPTVAWWAKQIHPDDKDRVVNVDPATVRSGTAVTEYRVRHKDGRWLHVEDRAVLLRDDSGKAVRLVGCTTDITTRKQATEQLQFQHDLTKSITDNATTAIFMMDDKSRCTFMNPAAEQMTGFTFVEVEGRILHDAIHHRHPDGQPYPMHECPIDRALPEHFEVRDHEDVFIRKNGEYFPVVCNARVIYKQGIAIGTVIEVRDVTSEKQAADEKHRLIQQLRESESRFTVALQNTRILVYTTDADLRYTWIHNPHPAFKTADVLGRRDDELLSPEQAGPLIAVKQDVLRSGVGSRTEFTVEINGESFVYDLTIEPLRDGNGNVIGVTVAAMEVTHRKKIEAELRLLAAELSEVDRKKNEFLATLAHELRNPLAPIRNGLELMKLMGGQEPTVEETHNMMERQLTQLVRLVDDLMDVSRISRGKLELRKEQISLATVLKSSIETSRPLIEQMGHQLSVTVPQTPIIVEADATRLAQVFMNLLNNSAKYSERGSQIWLTAERHGNDVVVSVRDTGIGIPADKLVSIFDMFNQVDRSLERSQGGLGIGLSLVKRLVEMHGGMIEAKSDGLGRGSEFIVRLPVFAETSMPLTVEKKEPVATKSSLRILIVDDNRDGANSLSKMLELMGNETRIAYDGKVGFELANEFRPDVVLCDIGLPQLNGYEACRLIRQQAWGKKVIMIAITGWGQEDDRQRSKEAGFDQHMVKPVEPADLMKLLASLHTVKHDQSQ